MKRVKVAIELVKALIEKERSYLRNEKKYNFINKFCPKKLPEQ